ncbi:reverse transcriptase/maturase family protein [Spartinivicinus marinus]|uniref:reverse transcriptase/maturase family protein n=1 Tax=Spartinivicinus marinus TaxID=2994442 RepID=UPI002254B586|nr:reverse transcriptase/maturase family protein [Spartinivicinus marinus]MCX4029628.1 reverse transcriptase/maturase family protein [Spartinivicinus marinus]
MSLIHQLASDEIIDEAFEWLCKSRKNSHYNNSVWHCRFHWQAIKPIIQKQLIAGDYRFSPCKACKIDGHSIGVWNAQDALVQKAMTLVLTKRLKPSISPCCFHLKGHGGAKAAVMKVALHCSRYTHVMKSDVKSYYASIDHAILIEQLRRVMNDEVVLDLITQFLNHLDDVNAELFFVEKGITKGSSLSPLLGALFLTELDNQLTSHAKKHNLVYVRFMDDWVLLTKTKRQLRTGVKLMNQVLSVLKMEKAPDKTFIGRITKGFNWLGYRLGPSAGLGVLLAEKTLTNHRDKQLRLYEQAASVEAVKMYIKRWWQWVRSGVKLDGALEGCLVALEAAG